MKLDNTLKQASKIAREFRITNGHKFDLRDFDPRDTLKFRAADKPQVKEVLISGTNALSEMQDKLYAQDQRGLLIIFQAMDAAGKDGAIKHVMSGVNPQGCRVASFKAPSHEELEHDFLWRCEKQMPNRGEIGIFNRSYYEETLVVRVHPEILESQRLPKGCITDDIWTERFQDIKAFERRQNRSGITIIKFFLNVSKGEQRKRFLERCNNPEKNWKFSAADVRERGFWSEYQKAYQETIQHTATEDAPWYVVPADNKWFTRMVVSSVIVDTLASMNLSYPKVDARKRQELAAAKAILMKKK